MPYHLSPELRLWSAVLPSWYNRLPRSSAPPSYAFDANAASNATSDGVISSRKGAATKGCRSALLPAPLVPSSQRNRQDDNGTADDQLLAEFQPHQDQAIVDQADHQRA
jgi:hypothetical protein